VRARISALALALGACGGPHKAAPPPPPPPPAATCAQLPPAVVRLVGQLRAEGTAVGADGGTRLGADMGAQSVQSCTDDRWSVAAIQCYLVGQTRKDFVSCDAQLTVEQRSHLADAMNAIVARDAPPPAAPPSTGTTGVPECDEYIAAVDQYAACDKVPAEARDAVQQGSAQMRDALSPLKDPTVPAEARKAAAEGCAAARDALRQSMTAMGCP
jgi:hypothetical protein